MKMMNEEEVWKEYPIEFEFENDFKIEVSDHGNVKTYNSKHPEGKVIKGSVTSGFPSVRLKLFKKRRPSEQQKLDDLNAAIDLIHRELKALGTAPRFAERKLELRKERDELVKIRSKYNAKVNLRRTINFGFLVHKAVAELFLEKPEGNTEFFVIHKDFDKTNNHVGNLAYVTQEDLNARYMKHPKNVLHHFKKQFMESVPNTKMGKLKENDVLYIKQRLKKGDTLRKLAKKFEVSDMQIHRIKTGENWKHVQLIEDIKSEKKK